VIGISPQPELIEDLVCRVDLTILIATAQQVVEYCQSEESVGLIAGVLRSHVAK